MKKKEATSEKLARALEEVNAPELMILRARQGYYDDFKTPLVTPIIELIKDAIEARIPVIAQMARDGKFDSTKEEGESWLLTTEGKQILDDLKKRKINGNPKTR